MQQKYYAGFQRLLGAMMMVGFSFVLTVTIAFAGDDPSLSTKTGRVLVDIHGPSMSMGYTLTRWLPSQTDGARLRQVQINGGNIVAPVEAGSEFTVKVAFSIVESSCPTCIAQIVVGFSHKAPEVCVYDAIPGATVKTGTKNFKLQAPSTPGRYYLAFDHQLQFTCQDALDNTSHPLPPDQYFAVIDVY